MSRTLLHNSEIEMCLFLDEASYWAEKLPTYIDLPPLTPGEDDNFGGDMVFILENDDVTGNSRILFAHSDWLLKFGIVFAMLGPSTIEN